MYFFKYTYYRKDEKFLKNDYAMRQLFFILFNIVTIWQLINVFSKQNKQELTTPLLILSIFVIVTSLIYSIICFAYAMKNLKILNNIKENGNYTTTENILPSIKDGSCIKILQFINLAVSLILTFVFVFSLLYVILKVSFMAKISFYFPTLLLLCFVGYFTVYHIHHEIKIVQNILE